jgi:hypothetical protein
MKKNIFIFLICTHLSAKSQVLQINPYCFSQNNTTYSPITSGTVLGTTSNDDQSFQNLPIGFDFNFKGTIFTRFCVNTNGYITLGDTSNGVNFNPISSPIDNNVISALGTDLLASSASVLHYQLIGAAPNRELIVEWKNYSFYGDNSSINFQISLNESSNEIHINFGDFNLSSISVLAEIGLIGVSSNISDFNNILINQGLNTWSNPIIVESEVFSFCELSGSGFKPSSGLRYIYNPSSISEVTSFSRFCSPSSLTLNVTSTSSLVNWYDHPFSTIVIDTGLIFNTQTLFDSDTFYVSQNNCISQRIPVIVMPYGELFRNYIFTQNNGTYTEIIPDSILAPFLNDDIVYDNIPIGFDFKFNRLSFSSLSIACNGFISFDLPSFSTSTPISYPENDYVASVLGGDLEAQDSSTLSYNVIGSFPNRIFTIQWKNYSHYGDPNSLYNVQIKLFETTNEIQFVYGEMFQPIETTYNYEIGLSSNTSMESQFIGRKILSGINTWSNSISSNSRIESFGQIIGNIFEPTVGLTYHWLPLDIYSILGDTICNGNSSLVTVNSFSNNLSWYTDSIGGSILSTNNFLTTPILNSNTVYYVEILGEECVQEPRTQINVFVDSCASIKEYISNLDFFPNPTNDYIFFNIDTNQFYEFEIYKVDGTLLVSKKILTENTIDLSGFDDGLYTIKLKNENTTTLLKILKHN